MSFNQTHTQIASLLIDLEAHLRRFGAWNQPPPSAEALKSTLPFCYDTMPLTQWLQYVFLPRMHDIIDKDLELPNSCSIEPVASVFFAEQGYPQHPVIGVLAELDKLITEG